MLPCHPHIDIDTSHANAWLVLCFFFFFFCLLFLKINNTTMMPMLAMSAPLVTNDTMPIHGWGFFFHSFFFFLNTNHILKIVPNY